MRAPQHRFSVYGVKAVATPGESEARDCSLQVAQSRPRITGKSVEKLLGHAVHFMMLKRELLSCFFRSLYDFVQANCGNRLVISCLCAMPTSADLGITRLLHLMLPCPGLQCAADIPIQRRR